MGVDQQILLGDALCFYGQIGGLNGMSLQREQAAEHGYFAEFHHVPAVFGVMFRV
jgi:hypothetical protein